MVTFFFTIKTNDKSSHHNFVVKGFKEKPKCKMVLKKTDNMESTSDVIASAQNYKVVSVVRKNFIKLLMHIFELLVNGGYAIKSGLQSICWQKETFRLIKTKMWILIHTSNLSSFFTQRPFDCFENEILLKPYSTEWMICTLALCDLLSHTGRLKSAFAQEHDGISE